MNTNQKTSSWLNFSAKDMALIGMFAALTAICAQIAFIPMPNVKITLQTFAVFLSVIVLGTKCGTLSQIIYLLLGAVGVPVFAAGTGGFNILAGVTGGYLWSFPIVALVIGLVMNRKKNVSRMDMIGLLVLGTIICYTCGTIQLGFILKFTYVKAITIGVTPYLPFDILKIIAAAYLGFEVRKALIKARLL